MNSQNENMGRNDILEIGTFFGYSAINMAKKMSSTSKLVTIEASEENANVAKIIITRCFSKYHPDIMSRIQILTGKSSDILLNESLRISLPHFSFVYLDHDKDSYLPDLKTLEQLNMLDPIHCTVVADNVGMHHFLIFNHTNLMFNIIHQL